MRSIVRRDTGATYEEFLTDLAKAVEIVETGIDGTLSYYAMPTERRRYMRTNNPLKRLMRETRRRTRVMGEFPDDHSALMLVAARFQHIAAK